MQRYQDKCLSKDSWIIKKIRNENMSQLSKWGIQIHSSFEWLAYLTEEIGELAQSISEHEYRDGKKDQVIKEAIQVAALALKIAEMFDDDI